MTITFRTHTKVPKRLDLLEPGKLFVFDHAGEPLNCIQADDGGDEASFVVLSANGATSHPSYPQWFKRSAFHIEAVFELGDAELFIGDTQGGGVAIPSSEKPDSGDVLVDSAGAAFIYFKSNRPGEQALALNLQSGVLDRPPQPRSVYKSWRLVGVGDDGKPWTIAERHPSPNKD